MSARAQLHRDQQGVVGKIIVVWLVLVAVFGVTAVDTVSILFTKFHDSDLASNAAADAANKWRDTNDENAACQTATQTVATEDNTAHIPTGGCIVNTKTGEVTITVRKEAHTLVAGKIGPLEKFAKTSATETSGPTAL
jgi:hypothetical protein